MKILFPITVAAAALATIGCASAQKTWQGTNTISVPECSVAFNRSTQGSAYSNQFSNTGLSTKMVVLTPFGEHPKVFQEIADESCARLEKKISALGYTVVTGADLVAKSEKYAELQKEDFTKEPDIRDQYAYFGSTKTGVPKGGRGFSVNMAYGSISRNGGGIVAIPSFAIGFGGVKGSGDSVTSATGMTTSSTRTKYSPMILVHKDYTTMPWFAGDMAGTFEVSKGLQDDSTPWMYNIVKGDTSTNALSAVSSLMFGGRLEKTAYYTMEVDPVKMKEAILAQLDKAENEYVSQIQKLKTN